MAEIATLHPRVVIDRSAILSNLAALRTSAGRDVAAVLKANAYGHGLRPVAEIVDGLVRFLAVTDPADAEVLLDGAVSEVLLLGPAHPAEQAEIASRGCHIAIDSLARMDAFTSVAPPGASVHLLVDTGQLRRTGLSPADVDRAHRAATAAGLHVVGAFIHPATADSGDWYQVAAEVATLDAVLPDRPIVRHHGGTSVAIEHPELGGDMVRLGIGLYGFHPHERQRAVVELFPALRLEATVLALHHVREGEPFGYAGQPPADRSLTMATVGIGVAHGFTTEIVRNGMVAFGDTHGPLVGAPSLEYCHLDTTNLPGIRVGSVVTVLGGSPASPASVASVAARLGVVPDHILAGISPRIARSIYP